MQKTFLSGFAELKKKKLLLLLLYYKSPAYSPTEQCGFALL